jgi:hypothetical protein
MTRAMGGLLVPVRKQPGLKGEGFSLTLLVPIATIGTNRSYKLGLMVFFPRVASIRLRPTIETCATNRADPVRPTRWRCPTLDPLI